MLTGVYCKRGLFLFLLLIAVCVSLFPSLAQDLTEQRQQTQVEIEELRNAIALSEERKSQLVGEIASLESDRATINRQLIDSSSRSRAFEKNISRSGERLGQLRSEQGDVRESLNERKGLLAEILGALQRMGRKPPPALLVTPGDALSSVRSAILLGAVVPEVRAETEVLLVELRELLRISNGISKQQEKLQSDLSELALEEERLKLLLEQKRKLSGVARSKLVEESKRAAELAAKATSLNSLIVDLEREIESVQKIAEATKLADEERRKHEQERVAGIRQAYDDERLNDTGRLSPAISFDKAKGLLQLPASGVILADFGDEDISGEASKGVSIATRVNSNIISPSDGWILYAGPFRSYGMLLILNAGNGYHVVLAGMEKTHVQPGQFVLMGEPIGSMGVQRVVTTGLVDVTSTRPILYVEFRKDGKSIDSSPWWADNNLKRVSNDS